MQTHRALAVGSILLFSKIGTYQRGGEEEEKKKKGVGEEGGRGDDTQISNLGILNFLIIG